MAGSGATRTAYPGEPPPDHVADETGEEFKAALLRLFGFDFDPFPRKTAAMTGAQRYQNFKDPSLAQYRREGGKKY
jgi:hypothetical protein